MCSKSSDGSVLSYRSSDGYRYSAIGIQSSQEFSIKRELDGFYLDTKPDWVSKSKFVAILETSSRMIFLLSESEQATESNSRRKMIQPESFAASICKDDQGDAQKNFQSFAKAPFMCDFGDFSFPVLHDAVEAGNEIFAVFSTKRETFRKSALCFYAIEDVEKNITNSGKGIVSINIQRCSIQNIS